MATEILVDGKGLPLNNFINSLSGNIIDAIARSLKYTSGKRIEFELQEQQLRLIVDGSEVPLDMGSAREILQSLLRGLLQGLHGTESGKHFRLIYERTNEIPPT